MCCHCKKDGATISCYNKTCSQTYHFNCAYETNCFISDDLSKILLEKLDKRQKSNGYFLYCSEHSKTLPNGLCSTENLNLRKLKKNLIVNLKDDNYRRKYSFPKFSLLPPKSNPFIMIGSLQIEGLGDLETVSDFKEFLCPVNFTSTRLYWSSSEIGKKVVYKCRIRHINEFKRDNQKTTLNNSNLIDSNDIKFYLDNFYDKEESLANLNFSNEMMNDNFKLDSFSQLDGLNDNLFCTNQNQNNVVLKFPSVNTNGVNSVVQKFTQIGSNQLNILNRPLVTNNQNLNFQKNVPQTSSLSGSSSQLIAEKPKVLKLDSNLKCFSNIKTSFVRFDRAPVVNQQVNFTNSDFYTNKNFLLNSKSKQSDMTSPRSDRSDSSLNLNHSLNLINPMSMQFEDLMMAQNQTCSPSLSSPCLGFSQQINPLSQRK